MAATGRMNGAASGFLAFLRAPNLKEAGSVIHFLLDGVTCALFWRSTDSRKKILFNLALG